MIDVFAGPNAVSVQSEAGWLKAARAQGNAWSVNGSSVFLTATDFQIGVALESTCPIKRIHLRWQGQFEPPRILGDQWERGYGDLGWQGLVPERVMPWYVMVVEPAGTTGYGVKTGSKAMCFWLIDSSGLSLVLDVRSGSEALRLGHRILDVATVVAVHAGTDRSPFAATQQLCERMCENPKMPTVPIYGGNNWYYAYGKSSYAEIMDDSRRISDWAGDHANRPFMVIDDGWQYESGRGTCNGGPWIGNPRFGDMQRLADEMAGVGVRPGIWMRPLLTTANVPAGWVRTQRSDGNVLDPSVPEVVDYVCADVAKLRGWGYQLIKHDFSSFDMFDRWGFDWGSDPAGGRMVFRNRSQTTAEVVGAFYSALASASAESLLLGCNTIGHLGAGHFEIQRTGDDTSGRDWERTRKMGINTLAFRMPQHGRFFSTDADCVGITDQVPWTLNQQWLRLLAASGTPLFVSAEPAAVGPEQARAIRNAFAVASRPLPVAEPLDWMETTCPTRWLLEEKEVSFDWFEDQGIFA